MAVRSRPDGRPPTRCALRRGRSLRGPATPKPKAKARGKSELRRAVRRVTPGQGDLKDSGTENIPPAFARFAGFGAASSELASP